MRCRVFEKRFRQGSSRPMISAHPARREDRDCGLRAGRAGQDPKLVAHFEGEAIKPLALNLTNAPTVAEITGTDDYQAWPGHVIQLFVTSTEFQGNRVPCIRIRRPQQAVPTNRPDGSSPRWRSRAPRLATKDLCGCSVPRDPHA